MITRKHYLDLIRERLKSFPVVSVLGPRQVGKTTLARVIAGEQPGHFFDLEDVDALARLAEPKAALERLEGLVVLDEVQRKPELFALLRVLAERLATDAGIFASRSHDAFVAVLDGDGDEPIHLQVGDIGLNLAFADSEEFGKVAIGSVTAALVIERMDFDEQHFFHDRELGGFPDFLRNPDAFEIS
jgi:hypothetical protein